MASSTMAFGRYELRGELGHGGFATVYRAWDPALRREVAIKALLPHLAREPDLRRRFLTEAQTLARLQHPHIVQVYDVGEADDRPFFAMALVDGQTLSQVLSTSEKLPLDEVIVILESLGSALDALHEHGLVHRDLKPQNVMLDKARSVVLMDLGIARDLESTALTRTGVTLGTPAYMAPEQVAGRLVGPATDIYALGVLSYHLLADRPPFQGDTPSVLHAQVYEPPPPLKSLRPGLPDSVYVAIGSALAKDPAQRPPSAHRFVEVLRGTLPAQALPAARSPSWQRRLPYRALGLMLLLIFALAAAGIASYLAFGRSGGSASGTAAAARGPAQTGNVARPPLPGGAASGNGARAPTQTAPSKDCAPASLAPGRTTACSTFLNSALPRGSTVSDAATAPAGVRITACRSESAGLSCGAVSGTSATVTCTAEPCRLGAQFTLDITAPTPGRLNETVTITLPDGTTHTFTYSSRATFSGAP